MFDRVSIRPSKNVHFDLGQIAESLLFYKEVKLVCGVSFFHGLTQTDQTDAFLELMKSGKIKVHLEDNFLGSMRKPVADGKFLWQRPVLMQGKNVSLSDRLLKAILENTGRMGYSKRLANRILTHSEIHLHPGNLIDFVEEDIDNQVYLKKAIAHTIKLFNPDYEVNPEEIKVVVNKIQQGLILDSNIDFDSINKTKTNEYPISLETVLFNVMNTRQDLMLASTLNSDIVSSRINSVLMNEKINSFVQSSITNQEQIELFAQVVLKEGHKIREVISSGERKFSDFLSVLEKADKFKDWLKKLDNNDGLLSEYHKAVTEETWVDKLPGKTFRWSFFTGAGLVIDAVIGGGVGTLTGVALGAGDTFLLDKIIKGWKPDSFVNGELEKFVAKNS
ncbi:MAG: hypothetical protein HYZ14_10410 [Bacteroidetes bacterium]|nr:hypothetical protein [Bacteroidota bacterium]